MSKIQFSLIKNIIKKLFLVLLLSLMAFVFYWTVYRDIDSEICYKNIANQLNIEPSYWSLFKYIENILPVGLSRADVYKRLQVIAPFHVTPDESNSGTFERITLQICNHPFNNPDFHVRYTYGGTLISIRVEESP